jgi:hypothetical protein
MHIWIKEIFKNIGEKIDQKGLTGIDSHLTYYFPSDMGPDKTIWEKINVDNMDQNGQLAKSSEKIVQRQTEKGGIVRIQMD